METEQIYQQELQEVKVTPESKAYFVEAANWGTFLAIVGYLGIAIMVIFGIFVMLAGGKLTETMEAFEQVYGFQESAPAFKLGSFFTGFLMLAIAVLYFFPVYYLHQFSSKVKYGVNSLKQESFDAGVRNLKSLFKFMGILTIVMIAIYVLAIVFVLIGVAIAS